MKKNHLYDEVYLDGYIRLIEGLFLNVLDKITISGKWHNREITISMIAHKLENINEAKGWINSEKCDIWLNVYSYLTGRSARRLKKSFKRELRKVTRYIHKLCRSKNIDIKELFTEELEKGKTV